MSSLELRERHVSAAFLDAKFTCIAILEEVTTVMSAMPGADKNESQQKFKLFKSRKESMTVHKSYRQNESNSFNFHQFK